MNQAIDGRALAEFEEQVVEHAPMLVSYLSAITGSRGDAEDLAQEAFLRAYRSYAGFDGANFPGWLRTIGRNAAIDRLRARRRELTVESEVLEGIGDVFAALSDAGERTERHSRLSAVRACLESLSDKLRQACRLYYFEDLSAAEAAQRLGTGEDALLKRLERARRALRECAERKLGLKPVGEPMEVLKAGAS